MKRLNRRQLRRVILNEVQDLKEEERSLAGNLKMVTGKALNKAKEIAKSDGIIAALGFLLVDLQYDAMMAAVKILSDTEKVGKIVSAYGTSLNFDAAYSLYCDMLIEVTGL